MGRTNGCHTTDSKLKYSSNVAARYKNMMGKLTEDAMKKYGTSVIHLPSTQDEMPMKSAKKQEDFFSDIIMTDSMKLGASKPAKPTKSVRSVNKLPTNVSRNNNKPAPKTTASRGPSVNLALDSWNNKAEEKPAPKKIEANKSNGVVAKKNAEKGDDFFKDFDDEKKEEKVEEATAH